MPGHLHAVMNSLCSVAFGNDVQLSVKSLQLPQILGLKDPEKLILDLADFTFTGYPVKILNIIQNILHQIGLHL